MSTDFNTKLLRLKVALGLAADYEVGAMLGLSQKAFSARKTKGSFPERDLRALAQRRPDLNLDVDHILGTNLPAGGKDLHSPSLDERMKRIESHLVGIGISLLSVARAINRQTDVLRAGQSQPHRSRRSEDGGARS
jgi:hypothetical protein